MSYTFLNQQSKLSSLLGDSNTSTDDQFPSASRLKELNRGEMDFCRRTKLIHEKVTGTVAASQLAWPSDMLEPYVLIVDSKVITKDREISAKDYERWATYNGSTVMYYISEESGTRYFKFLGSSTGLTYILFYIKKPSTELSSDSDTSILPEELREASVYYAASELMRQIGKNEIANTYWQKYMDLVREGIDKADEMYMDKQYANPDVNAVGPNTTDVQGGGFDYSWG